MSREHCWRNVTISSQIIYEPIQVSTTMNNFARVILVFAVIFTGIGAVGFLSGAAVAATDLEEYAIVDGTQGQFSVTEDHLGLEVYASGTVSCSAYDVTITDSSGSTEGEFWGDYFDQDCGGGVEFDGYTYIGSFSILHDAGDYSISSNNPIILLDTSDGWADAIGGGLLALCSLPLLICGVIGLIAGGILGAVMKDKQNVVVAHGQPQPVYGAPMQNLGPQGMVPVQQYPAQPAQQPHPQTMYQQPPNQGQPPQL
jgi:hypothetical protein